MKEELKRLHISSHCVDSVIGSEITARLYAYADNRNLDGWVREATLVVEPRSDSHFRVEFYMDEKGLMSLGTAMVEAAEAIGKHRKEYPDAE